MWFYKIQSWLIEYTCNTDRDSLTFKYMCVYEKKRNTDKIYELIQLKANIPEDFQDQSFHLIPIQYVNDLFNQDVLNGGIQLSLDAG